MKKIFTNFKQHAMITAVLMLSFSSTLMSQDVDRQYVLLEKFTGTWCSPCAGAEVEMHRAISEGCDYAVIEYHQGADVFKNELANYRTTFYNNSSYPAFVFDGEYTNTNDYYNTIVEYYNSRKVIKSPLFIEVEKVKGQTLRDWTFNVKVNRVNSEFSDVENIRLFATVVESDIKYNWYLSGIDYLGRTSITSLEGEKVTFNNNLYQKQLTVELDAEIQIGNSEIVFFVQDMNTKEVIQAYKTRFIDEEIITQIPTVTKAEQLKGTQSIIVEWTMPDTKVANLLGYNVYSKANKKLNTTGVITEKYYVSRRQNISSEQCFYVTAVYDIIEGEDSNMECGTVILLTSPTSFDTINRGNANNMINLKWNAPIGYDENSGNSKNVLGYNVYRNAEKVNSELITQMQYQDIAPQIGKYIYHITAVYGNHLVEETIESPKSEQIQINVNQIKYTSINEPSSTWNINIYPNPVKNMLKIDGQYTSLKIYNIVGELVEEIKSHLTSINISTLANGTYIIKVYNNDQVKVSKIQIIN